MDITNDPNRNQKNTRVKKSEGGSASEVVLPHPSEAFVPPQPGTGKQTPPTSKKDGGR